MTNQSLLNEKNLGNVMMNMPVHYMACSIGAIFLLICILVFIFFAEFSEQVNVQGYLNASQGLTHIYPQQKGFVSACYVQQGSEVKRGMPLYLIDTAYDNYTLKHRQNIFKQLQQRKVTLENNIRHKSIYLAKLKPLLEKKYISTVMYDAQYDAIVALENQKHTLDIQLLRYTESRAHIIRAPIDGVVTSLMYHAGQYTNSNKPLAIILPKQTALIAELYVPIKKSRLLKKGGLIAIRYDAYPYQLFGAAQGVIDSISRNSLKDTDEEKPIHVDQSYYKVIAKIDKQTILMYGKPKQLWHGMTFSAVIFGSKMKVWQWIFGPLFRDVQP